MVSLLEAKKPWKDEDQRPGTAAAWEVSREMEGGGKGEVPRADFATWEHELLGTWIGLRVN